MAAGRPGRIPRAAASGAAAVGWFFQAPARPGESAEERRPRARVGLGGLGGHAPARRRRPQVQKTQPARLGPRLFNTNSMRFLSTSRRGNGGAGAGRLVSATQPVGAPTSAGTAHPGGRGVGIFSSFFSLFFYHLAVSPETGSCQRLVQLLRNKSGVLSAITSVIKWIFTLKWSFFLANRVSPAPPERYFFSHVILVTLN